jgi:hypothetical protein
MHSWELAELAAHLANGSSCWCAQSRTLRSTALGEYWIASKCRLDRWNRSLKRSRRTSGRNNPNRHGLGALCHEILISEILSRVWSSVASALDANLGTSEAEPLAVSVLTAHLDVTNRVLGLLSAGFTPVRGVRRDLNRLRRQAERWTDLLLGRFGWAPGIAQFAHDTTRAADFAEDFAESNRRNDAPPEWLLLRDSLRSTFRGNGNWTTPNADLNSRIAAAILQCVPDEQLNDADNFDWMWRLRLNSVASATETLVAQFLEIGTGGISPLNQSALH